MFPAPVGFHLGEKQFALVDTETNGTSQVTYTFNSVVFGAPAANRILIVAGAWRAPTGRIYQSVTIGGVTATVAANSDHNGNTQNGHAFVVYASVPTGATGTIVVQPSGATNTCAIAVYRAVNLVSATPVDTDSQDGDSGGSMVGSIDIPHRGFAVAAAALIGNVPSTWNITEDLDFDDGGGTSLTMAHRGMLNAAVTGASVTAASAGVSSTLAVASWR